MLNEGKIAPKSIKNRCPCLSLKWVPKSTFKTQFWKSRQQCIFSTLVWPTLNEGQNSSKSHKNRYPCLCFKWVSKSTLKFNFEKFVKSAYFQPWFKQPWTRAKIAPNLIKIGFHAYFSSWYIGPKSTLKNPFRESRQKRTFSTLVWPTLNMGLAPNIIKNGVRAYLSNGYLNLL